MCIRDRYYTTYTVKCTVHYYREYKVGSVFVIEGAFHYWTLPQAASVYTAELYVMWQALHSVNTEVRNNLLAVPMH